MFHFWILSKYAVSWRKFFDVTIILTIAGICIGVSLLMVAMASFSGFETTLKTAIIEVLGDVNVYSREGKIKNTERLQEQLKPYMKEVDESLAYLTQESLVASRGKLSAVLIQGVEKAKTTKVLNLKNRIVDGDISWEKRTDENGNQLPPAFIGKDLLKKMGLKIGDSFKIIVPKSTQSNSSELKPIVQAFYVVAALDLGKYDFNSRLVFIDLPILQDLLAVKSITGLRFKLKDSDAAGKWAEDVQSHLGWTYTVTDWYQTNRNFLRALEYEKMVMFFVVLIIVIAACFNVATTLFVTVLKRYRDISLLKTLGATPRDIVIIFCLHGLFLGALGVGLGLLIGATLCLLFELAQKIFPILPSDVYRLSFVATEIRMSDVLMISGVTLGICFLSTLIPSIRGSKLSPIEGLKYE